MANALLLVTGMVMLVLQGLLAYALSYFLPADMVSPVLVIPMVLYMAVGDFSLGRGVSLSFVLGYFADVFAGGSIGLWTFSLVSIFLLVRVAGLRLFLHGVVFQMLLTFVASIFVGIEMMALLLVFDRRPLGVLPAMLTVVAQSVATALSAVPVFRLMRWLPTGIPGVVDET